MGGTIIKGTALQANKHQATLRTKMTQAAMAARAQDVCTHVRNTRAKRAQIVRKQTWAQMCVFAKTK
jgi:hypothetical protein